MQKAEYITKMPEVKHVIEDQEITYKGLCMVKDFYTFLDKWFADRGYAKQETKNYEEVTEKGKYTIVEMEPIKKVSDYVKLKLKAKIICFDLKSVDIEIDGKKQSCQEGEVKIEFEAQLITDYENKWEYKPVYFFFRTVMDKYVFKGLLHKYEQMLVKDCKELMQEAKAYLNLTSYRK